MFNSVLIVDDEENFLLLLDWILTKDGFRVKTASDAYQALNLLDNEHFNLAIVDIEMFPMDGIRLLSELRKRSPSTPVIMITAYPEADTLNECMRNGADALLLKPVNFDELKHVAHSLGD
jgi:DNA-binding response OmpR family regulator